MENNRSSGERLGKEVIFIVGKNPQSTRGGHSTFVRACARGAILIGLEPHLFAVGPTSTTTMTDLGVIHQIASPVRPFRALMLPIHGPLLLAAVKRFTRQQAGPHRVHSFGGWGAIGVKISEHLRLFGTRTIHLTSVFSTLPHEYLAKLVAARGGRDLKNHFVQAVEYYWIRYVISRYERDQMLLSDLVLVNYDSVRRIVEETYGVNPRIRKVSYCSDKAFPRDQSSVTTIKPRMNLERASPGTLVILSISRQDPRKGHHVLLPALAELRDQGLDFRALLVGGGMLLETNQRLVARLGLDGIVSLEGWVADVSPYLHLADVFVLPSIEEGSGSLSLLEAMQAGLPAVVSNIDGVPEDVVDEESALLVEPGDVSALAISLRRLLEDRTLRERLGTKARAVYEARFSASALTSSLREVYTEAGFFA